MQSISHLPRWLRILAKNQRHCFSTLALVPVLLGIGTLHQTRFVDRYFDRQLTAMDLGLHPARFRFDRRLAAMELTVMAMDLCLQILQMHLVGLHSMDLCRHRRLTAMDLCLHPMDLCLHPAHFDRCLAAGLLG